MNHLKLFFGATPEFQQLMSFNGYSENHLIYSWTGSSLMDVPFEYPKTHLDCLGWFNLYRTMATEQLLLPPLPPPLPKEDQEPDLKGGKKEDGKVPLTKIAKKFESKTTYPQLSILLDVEVHFTNGRKVFAKEFIPTGEVLAKDTAYALVTFRNSKSEHVGKQQTSPGTSNSSACVVCSYCLTFIAEGMKLIICDCFLMRYCSQTCHDRAHAEFHKYDCRAFLGLDLDYKKKCHKQLFLALRAICVLGPEKAYETYGRPLVTTTTGKQIQESRIPHPGVHKKFMPGVANGKFDSESMMAVMAMGLAGNFGDLPNPELCNLTAIEANIVIRVLEQRTPFFDGLCPGSDEKLEEFKIIMGGLAYNILLGLKEKTVMMTSRNKCSYGGDNASKVKTTRNFPKFAERANIPWDSYVYKGKNASQNIGKGNASQDSEKGSSGNASCNNEYEEHINASGIFPTISLFHHSCFPNAFVVFEGRTAYVIAAKPIRKNEEICISWFYPGTCPNPENLTREERMKILKQSSMTLGKFCICKLCGNIGTPWDRMTPYPSGFGCSGVICSSVGAELSMPLVHVSGLTFECWTCRTPHHFKEVKDKIHDIILKFERDSEEFDNGNVGVSPDNTAEAINALAEARAHDSHLTFMLDDFYKKLVISQGITIKPIVEFKDQACG